MCREHSEVHNLHISFDVCLWDWVTFLRRATMAASAPVAIHSELLCFIYNKVQSVPFEVVAKQCLRFYSSEQIQEAKDLFWKTTVTISEDLSD